MAKKKKDVKVEPVADPEPVANDEEEVTCPVCGKPVGLDVLSCPHCGAEFEAEETEEIVEEPVAKPAPRAPAAVGAVPDKGAVSGEDMAECPVCGNSVSLAVPSCPYCGAEFEEEEVEEVIEVEEQPVPVPAAKPRPPPARPRPEEVVEVEEVAEEEPVAETFEEEPVARASMMEPPSSITDLRVIGISLIVLGIIGSQISFFIDWYWTWVPPIEDNLGMFLVLPAVVIVLGLLVFMMIKRSSAGRKAKRKTMLPGVSLSIFLFGIIALIMVLLWNPINDALQNSSVGVALGFVAVLIVGVLAMFMGQKMNMRASAT